MDNLEILKKSKISYENILDLLKNRNISEELSEDLQRAASNLKDLYDLTYSNMLNGELTTATCCRNCDNNLLISDNIDYSYQCAECDENYYDFEVDEDIVWYKRNDKEDKKLNSSFYLELSYDNDEKNVIIGTESSSGAKYNCESVEELINNIKNYCYDYLDLEEYSIEFWETDWHRNAGEGLYYHETYSNYEDAIKKARQLFEENNYSSIEVLDNCNEAIYCRDDESEDFYFNGDEFSYVDEKIVSEYIDNWTNKKTQSFKGNKLYCQENDLYVAIDNSSGNCWVEQFKTEKETQNWLLGKDLETAPESERGIEL